MKSPIEIQQEKMRLRTKLFLAAQEHRMDEFKQILPVCSAQGCLSEEDIRSLFFISVDLGSEELLRAVKNYFLRLPGGGIDLFEYALNKNQIGIATYLVQNAQDSLDSYACIAARYSQYELVASVLNKSSALNVAKFLGQAMQEVDDTDAIMAWFLRCSDKMTPSALTSLFVSAVQVCNVAMILEACQHVNFMTSLRTLDKELPFEFFWRSHPAVFKNVFIQLLVKQENQPALRQGLQDYVIGDRDSLASFPLIKIVLEQAQLSAEAFQLLLQGTSYALHHEGQQNGSGFFSSSSSGCQSPAEEFLM